jgi:hypothetical protein
MLRRELGAITSALVKAIIEAPVEAPVEPEITARPETPAPQPNPEPTTQPIAIAQPTTRPSTRPSGRTRVPMPLGYAGPEIDLDADGTSDLIPIPDRWRIGTPSGYLEDKRESAGSATDPYNQNVLKGDYPIIGQDKFLVFTATSDTLYEMRKLPVPSGTSAASNNRNDFFGSGDQQFFNQNFILSAEFFQGDSAYKPRDFELRATLVFNYNRVDVEENQLINVDVRDKSVRDDGQFAVQELFFEKHLGDLSPNYDFWAVRIGTQGFNADFRGWLFNDFEPGVRFFGNLESNRIQWNVAAFAQVEKDTNSGLNTFQFRDQYVFVANAYRQDTFFAGYTLQGLLAANLDSGDLKYDENGGLVRPAPVGEIGSKEVRAYYLGIAGEGKWGRFNVSHQFYQVFGEETFNPIAAQKVDINAQFAALEVSYDVDWARLRASVLYASGDDDPNDDKAGGFDGIFDNPNFAGSNASYFARQAIRLTGSGVNLTNRNSFYTDLRTSKDQGQANFVNPGLILFNLGLDAEVTPKLRIFANASYLEFADPSALRDILLDDKISRSIGVDLSLSAQYRPFHNNNCIITGGIGALLPADGFDQIYFDETVFSTFISMTLTY